jgi:hypothetical protein
MHVGIDNAISGGDPRDGQRLYVRYVSQSVFLNVNSFRLRAKIPRAELIHMKAASSSDDYDRIVLATQLRFGRPDSFVGTLADRLTAKRSR